MSRFKINKLGIIPRIPISSRNSLISPLPLPPIRQTPIPTVREALPPVYRETPIPTARDIEKPVIANIPRAKMPDVKVGTAPITPYEGTVVRNPDLTLSISALRGSGLLLGYSGLRPTGNNQSDNDPTAPWNSGPVRKWMRKTLAGDFSYQSPGAQCPTVRYIFLGADQFINDPYGPTAIAVRREYGFQEVGSTCNQVLVEETSAEDFNVGVDEVSATLTQSNVVGNEFPGTGSRTLEEPTSIYDALAFNGSPYTDQTITSIESLDTTSPGSPSPISFTNAVAVRLSIIIEHLENNTNYVLNIATKRTNINDRGETIITIDIPFVPTDGYFSTLYFLPVEVGFTYQYLSNQLIKY